MTIEKINEILSSNLSEEEKLEKIKKISTESASDSVESAVESEADPVEDSESDFEKLKKILDSDQWPEAVLEFQIADDTSEEDKTDRAEGIVDILIEESLENKKFLDFGCGEGHAAKYASEDSAISVGYDIEKQGSLEWENDEKFLLTTDFEKVKAKGPFDVILIYDVVDHSENPAEVLNKAKSVLANNGTIYLRCHPWSSRHGGHAYRKINKAFIHLVFSEEELKNLGIDNGHNNKVLFPIATYARYLKEVGLPVKHPDIEEQEVEPFFKNNELVRKRILQAFNRDNWEADCPSFQMGQCFLDYVIKLQ